MDNNNTNSTKVDERLYISRQTLLEWETKIRLQRHIERYALLRQFAQGVVCDVACGCGYGSYLLATNPDVKLVIGLDKDIETINYANKEYKIDKTEFHAIDLEKWNSEKKIDMLISVETIEHLENPLILSEFVDRNDIDDVILTYPSKKTTHYNHYHYHDFKLDDITKIFSKFSCYKYFNWEYEFDVVFLKRLG